MRYIKKLICTFIYGIIVVFLCGCSNSVTEGEIYAKEHRKEYVTVMCFPLVTTEGNTVTTKTIPYIVYYPERYIVFIKAYQNGKWLTEDFYVSKEIYDAVNIGDMFFFDEERGDLEEEPYKRERKES